MTSNSSLAQYAPDGVALKLSLNCQEVETDIDCKFNPDRRAMSQSPVSPTMPDTPTCNESTLILLDWDDTLFPTSMICSILADTNQNGLALICDSQIQLLEQLGTLTFNFLSDLIQKYGPNNIHIVTNSLQGWIKDSLFYASCIAKVYKAIEILLNENEITMDSARSLYGGPKSKRSTPTLWKKQCFDALFKGSKTNCHYFHVISIGDQWADHDSVKQSIGVLSEYTPTHHIIKLKTEPNLLDMINETAYMQTCFVHIFDVISTPNTIYFDHPKAVEPVLIDYRREELKRYQNHQRIDVNAIHK